MKNIRFRVVSLFLVLFSALPLKINNLDSFELHKFKSAAKVESNVVAWSYKDVLHSYYQDYESYFDSIKIDSKNKIGFDDFIANYYSQDLDIKSYTEGMKFGTIDADLNYSNDISVASNSSDEDYILKTIDDKKESTPVSAFERLPKYSSVTSEFYKNIIDGDIIYETVTSFWNCGHTAIVVDAKRKSEFAECPTYIQTIEAVPSGVKYGFLDDERIARKGIKILRVIIKDFQDHFFVGAKEFLYKQLGKNYNLDINRCNKSIDSNEWYCSELTWAAYEYGGIDLACIDGVHHGQKGNDSGVLPYMIYICDFTNEVDLSPNFVDIKIINKSGSTWTINVHNKCNQNINVFYNSKMCFFDDCMNIGALKDLRSINLNSYASKDVQINQNLFADAITFYWDNYQSYKEIRNGILKEVNYKNRYFTYANQLVSATKKMLDRKHLESIELGEREI